MKKILSSTLVLLSTTLLSAEDTKLTEGLHVTAELKTTVEKTSSTEESAVTDVNANKLRAFNAGVKIGTLGLGLDISTPINDKLSARFNLNGATYTDTDSQDGNDFEGTLDLLTAGVLVDYYPFENNFRLSGGAYYNGNGFTGNVKPSATTTIDINGYEYDAGKLGSIDSKIEFDKIAPYLGLGWGNDAHDKGWGFTFDLGVMYHGEGKATLTPKGIAAIVDRIKLDSDVQKEEDSINDDLAKVKLYPVLALGVNYTF